MQFYRTACFNSQRLSQTALIATLPTETKMKEFFENLDPAKWQIISFDPPTRQVCIKLITPSGDRYLGVTIPVVSLSQL